MNDCDEVLLIITADICKQEKLVAGLTFSGLGWRKESLSRILNRPGDNEGYDNDDKRREMFLDLL